MIDINQISLQELQQLMKEKKKNLIEKQKNLRSNEELINEFLNSLHSKNTQNSYKAAIKRFVNFINKKNLQLTTKLDFDKYFNHLNNNEKIRRKTKKIRMAGITSFFQYFIHKQEIDSENILNLHFLENPIAKIQKKWKNDEEENTREILNNDEIKRVLNSELRKDARLYLMFYILTDTSMRGNGLINIKINNIDLEKRIIKTWDKGKMRNYIVGINLKSKIEIYLIMRKRINSLYDNKEYLFYSRKGSKVSSQNFFSHIYPKISKIIKSITGKKITAHDLRRSFKTNRTNLGQLREQIEALMNHKNGLDNAYNKPTHKMLLKWFDSYEEL